MSLIIEADDVAIVGYFDEFSRFDGLLTDNLVHILAVANEHKGNGYKDNDADEEFFLTIDFFIVDSSLTIVPIHPHADFWA